MERLSELFQRVREIAPPKRADYVRAACADEMLRERVLRLIGKLESHPDFLTVERPRDERLSPGTHLGRYQIVAEIGGGGAGVVYRAVDTTLRRSVALKVLRGAFAASPIWRSRFEQEAHALAALNHPNIATIHSLEAEETLFLTMELIEGMSLAERLETERIGIEGSVTMALDIARALEAAHGVGIVHRDLKPLNVMCTREGRVKVVDFGLAMEIEPDAEDDVSAYERFFTPFGTPGYVSPERLAGRPGDASSDVWSLGCCLFECLTGRRATTGRPTSSATSTDTTRPPELERLPAALPPAVRRLVGELLDADPHRRPEAGEIVRTLEAELGRLRPACDTGVRRGHVPTPASALIGREVELRALVTRLRSGGA